MAILRFCVVGAGIAAVIVLQGHPAGVLAGALGWAGAWFFWSFSDWLVEEIRKTGK
jgi:hypothetical protein